MGTDHVGWDTVSSKASSSGPKSGMPFLWLKDGTTYKVRLLGDPVCFYKYFHKPSGSPKSRFCICHEGDIREIQSLHPELKPPSARYAICVIDRNDNETIKIMESAAAVFRPFKKRWERSKKGPDDEGIKPGGGKGGDWEIEVDGDGATRYTVDYIEDTPLTADEVAAYKKAVDGDINKLGKIFEPKEKDEVIAMLFGTSKSSAPASNTEESSEPSSSNQESSGDTGDPFNF
jgi:hypothetical protein